MSNTVVVEIVSLARGYSPRRSNPVSWALFIRPTDATILAQRRHYCFSVPPSHQRSDSICQAAMKGGRRKNLPSEYRAE